MEYPHAVFLKTDLENGVKKLSLEKAARMCSSFAGTSRIKLLRTLITLETIESFEKCFLRIIKIVSMAPSLLAASLLLTK